MSQIDLVDETFLPFSRQVRRDFGLTVKATSTAILAHPTLLGQPLPTLRKCGKIWYCAVDEYRAWKQAVLDNGTYRPSTASQVSATKPPRAEPRGSCGADFRVPGGG